MRRDDSQAARAPTSPAAEEPSAASAGVEFGEYQFVQYERSAQMNETIRARGRMKAVKTPRRAKIARMQFAMLTQVNAAKRRCAMILHERFAKAKSQQGRRRDLG